MTAGQSYALRIVMQNTGNTTWTTADQYSFGIPATNGVQLWNSGRVPLPWPILPGGEVAFNFNVTAPSPGNYNFAGQMVQDGVEWFGQGSNSPVTVTAARRNDAQFVSQNVPATMVPGQTYPVTVIMQNTGTTTWPAGDAYRLGPSGPLDNTTWGRGFVAVNAATAPGQTAAFTFSVTAPSSPGTYNFEWKMLQSQVEWFGTPSQNLAIEVDAEPTTVTYIHTDALGSPVARSDSTGTVISRTQYEPYGRTVTGVMPTIGFTGHVNDADTGLVYMQQRYYDPEAGRFLSVDPVTTDASTGSSFNRYAYANNSPYKYVDPDGRNWALAGRGAILGAELGSVAGPWGAAAGAIIVGGGTLWLGDKAIKWIASSSNADSSKASPNTTSEGKSDSKSGSNGAGNNPYKGPATEPVTVVDQHGNAIPVDQGQRINTSPNGDFQQVIGADGKPTGDRLDRGGHPGQRDPSAQKPHGHRPGVTTPDGNPHLPIKPEVN
ncbi:MAG: repeat-associated core domain protein [Massilia sp.]|nr:repeat-associated core domain protein [Massilia sp.]